MSIHKKQAPLARTQLKYKLLIAYCLMSILPILAGVYIASLFITYPFDVGTVNLTVVNLVTLFSLCLSYLGYRITRQSTQPIEEVAHRAKDIAQGKLEGTLVEIKGVDELEELSESLKTISQNARELIQKVESLSLKDTLTGLYNATYLRERLTEEIQRAIHYQQPCSLAYFSIDAFDEFLSKNGAKSSEELLKTMADVLSHHLTELDRAARVSRSEFAVIFPDKNKKKVIQIAQSVQSEIARLPGHPFTVCAGISENPIDGALSEGLFAKAKDRLRAAKSSGASQVEALC